MKTAHTPAPWTTGYRPHNAITICGPDRDFGSGMTTQVVTVSNHRNKSEREANAQLIAAAPELLAALRQMVAAYGGVNDKEGCYNYGRIERACAAISKATREAAL